MKHMPIPQNFHQSWDITHQTITQFRFQSQDQLQGLQEKNSQGKTEGKVFYSRSQKKHGKLSYEISFQYGFLDSHIEAFKYFYNKYCKEINRILGYDKFRKQFNTVSTSQKFDYSTWLEEELKKYFGSDLSQQLQLYEDWIKEENLIKFLSTITNGVQSTLKPQFFVLVGLIWEKYLQTIESEFKAVGTQKKMQELLAKESQKIYHFQNLSNLTQNTTKSENIKSAFKQFLKSFSYTLYLIIEGYFHNPLSQLGSQQYEKLKKNDSFYHVTQEKQGDEDFSTVKVPKKRVKLD